MKTGAPWLKTTITVEKKQNAAIPNNWINNHMDLNATCHRKTTGYLPATLLEQNAATFQLDQVMKMWIYFVARPSGWEAFGPRYGWATPTHHDETCLQNSSHNKEENELPQSIQTSNKYIQNSKKIICIQQLELQVTLTHCKDWVFVWDRWPKMMAASLKNRPASRTSNSTTPGPRFP